MAQATLEEVEHDGAEHDAGTDADGDTNRSAGAVPARVELPAFADIRVAADLVEEFRAALAAEGDVEVHCGTVERLDAAVAQCLVALHGGLTQAGRRLHLVERTDAFERALTLVGMTEVMADDRQATDR